MFPILGESRAELQGNSGNRRSGDVSVVMTTLFFLFVVGSMSTKCVSSFRRVGVDQLRKSETASEKPKVKKIKYQSACLPVHLSV
jgi:hypothetical protein